MKRSFLSSSRIIVGLLVVVFALSVTLWMSCEKQFDSPVEPVKTEETIVLSKENPKIKAVMAVQDRHTPDIMANPDVVGTATGLTADGEPAILVFTKTEIKPQSLKKGFMIPELIENVPVVIEVTGPIVAYKGPPSNGVSHTEKQDPPIQLGTSGGWKYDIANGYCCGGTLGSLVTDGGKQYILSNSHVFVGDVVDGGNGIVAQIGDPIIQPGLIDVGCNASLAQDVANISSLSTIYPPLSTPNIDASIAEIIANMVRTDGAILEIGTIASTTVAAFINQDVKKSGRTTGLTRSYVNGLNATINVGYGDECAGGSFTKQFTDQIVIKNPGSKFLNSGDSGSLMVEDVDVDPRAVGLLYAGGGNTAIANPINDVLNYFGITMVGN